MPAVATPTTVEFSSKKYARSKAPHRRILAIGQRESPTAMRPQLLGSTFTPAPRYSAQKPNTCSSHFPSALFLLGKNIPEHPSPGISDAVFMTGRDGVNRERSFLEAWSRAGPDQKSWTDRSNTPAWGIVESSSGEWSMYVSKHYRMPDHRRAASCDLGPGSLHCTRTPHLANSPHGRSPLPVGDCY